jgi:nicotinate phosphoribosyltransferase
MGQVYWKEGLPEATFSLFFRSNNKRSYFVFSGINDVLEQIRNFSFDDEYLTYLDSLKLFDKAYLAYLKTFKFNGSIRSMRNGSLFFPGESVLEVTGNILESQLLETLIINEIHANTSLATKSSRIVQIAGKSSIVDFSARRTYGYDAAMKASKNAYISGFEATSNVDAGKLYGIPLSGTMGHSYVLSFPDESDSFLHYSKEFNNNSIFLVDTYDTEKGIKKVIDLYHKKSVQINGIRLDSGNIKNLSIKAREMLDDAGLNNAKIIVSGSMDEYKIDKLINKYNCPIDVFGVGSNFGVSSDIPVLECVFKLVEVNGHPVNKFSPNKTYYPYAKQVYRKIEGKYMNHDFVTKIDVEKKGYSPMLKKIYDKGEYLSDNDSVTQTRSYIKNQFEELPGEYKNIESIKQYKVIFDI